jgi:hypothetical protein
MTLSKSWPSIARDVLVDAARYYYREMKEPFPVPDVIMEQAIERANREFERRDRELREEASDRWIDRWESGKLDAEMADAIRETYDRLNRAERTLKPKKKNRRQLDADIAASLAKKTS